MRITRLDHFTIRTSRLNETEAFYVQVAGLSVGPRPAFKFPGRWLYQDGIAVVHLAAPAPDSSLDAYLGSRQVRAGTGPLDHIAFRCTGFSAFRAHLERLGIEHHLRTVPELGEQQVFVQDPNGMTVEFIFPHQETSTSGDTL